MGFLLPLAAGGLLGGLFGKKKSKSAGDSQLRTQADNEYQKSLGNDSSLQTQYTPWINKANESSQADRASGRDSYGRSLGSYDQAMGTYGKALGGYSDMAENGGITPGSENRFRGGGTYDEFAGPTGGYTAQNVQNIRSRATSPIAAAYGGMKRNLDRQQTINAFGNPGYSGQSQLMARDAASSIGNTSLDAELGIQDRIMSNRKWGAEGMTSSEGALQGLKTGNQLRALGGEESVAGGQAGVAAGQAGVASGQAQMGSQEAQEFLGLNSQLNQARQAGDTLRANLLMNRLDELKKAKPPGFFERLLNAGIGAAATAAAAGSTGNG